LVILIFAIALYMKRSFKFLFISIFWVLNKMGKRRGENNSKYSSMVHENFLFKVGRGLE
jgi:hypothetical protein